MKIIIDTHIFLWGLSDPKLIRKADRDEIKSLSNIIYVSSISIAEIMLKASLGRLEIDFNPVALAEESGFEMLSFSAEDALLLKEMPFHHKDPFDRMLIAQSIANKFHIMTYDEKFKRYDCKLI